jgi:Polyketide cyclase / dehydrase and lipid transport
MFILFKIDPMRNAGSPSADVIITINVPVSAAFNYIVPVDLTRIFKGYRSLPGIKGTSIREGWFTPGLSRTIYFNDGTSSQETLLTVVPQKSFSYQNDKFTGTLRFFTNRIEGKWLFTALGSGSTRIEWTYIVTPKNFIAGLLIRLFVMGNIRGMLWQALKILKSDLESGEYLKFQDKTIIKSQTQA